jgi:threonine/homoserine/homoserine lactone efflux protein
MANMHSQLLQSLLLGMAITALPGPVFFEVIRRTLADRASIGLFLVGNIIGMLIVISSTFLGLATLLSSKSANAFFYLLSGSVLIFIGISAILSHPKYQTAKADARKRRYKLPAIPTGITISAANPIGIVFWVSIIKNFQSSDHTLSRELLNCLSVMLGGLLVYAALIFAVIKLHAAVKHAPYAWLARACGFVVIIYGLIAYSRVV